MKMDTSNSTIRMSDLPMGGTTHTGSTFDACDIRGVAGATFTNCRFERCKITGDTEGVDLDGSTYDSRTIWPEGFVPEDHGARQADESQLEETISASMKLLERLPD